jgi:hypothetical protein
MRSAGKKGMVMATAAVLIICAGTFTSFKKDDKGITYGNLRVLPRNTSDEQLIAAMREISKSLGVSCSYCHKEIPGKTTPEGHPAHDFASDDKLQKRTARKMMRMTKGINENLDHWGHGDFERVSCMTCHRGHTEPSFTLDTFRSGLKDMLR